jgi:inosine-uridine nucleoside N-ribohydrolase
MAANNKTKILLDTDIGSDIDDAVCLAYLLANRQCDLLGITTVSGEPVQRAQMASALCKVAGAHTPIYPGAERPLLIEQKQPYAKQAARLKGWNHDTEFPDGQAVEFLRHTIRSYPGEITVLAIGPLTNIALLFSVDPEIAGMLKGLVLMAGVFSHSVAPTEWNIICDPHAAAIVYRAAAGVHRSIGLDVTTRVVMTKKDVTRKFTAPLLLPVLDFASVWFEHQERIMFHDPLAAATIFDKSVCTFERGVVSVELSNRDNLGKTTFQPEKAKGAHEIAVKVDPDRFFEHYFSVFQ